MPYNPGVNDISGQLRAQGMMRGGEGLLAGLTGGINILQQKKEEDKANIASIKAFDTLMKGMEGIAGQLDPKIQQAVQQYGLQINDTTLSNKQRAAIAAQGMKGLAEVMKIGSDVKQQNAIAEQNRLVNQARIDSAKAETDKARFEQQIGGLTGMLVSNGLKITPEIQGIASSNPQAFSIAMSKATELANKGVYEEEGEKDGILGTFRVDNVRGTRTFNPRILADGTIARMPTAQVASDPFSKLENGGSFIQGSAAERAARKDKLDEAERTRKTDEKTAADTAARATIAQKVNITLDNVTDAIKMLDSGTGGTFSGQPLIRSANAIVGGVLGVGQGAVELNDKYESIRGSLRFLSLGELRKAGVTPGQLSNAEGEALEKDAAVLNTARDEKTQKAALMRIAERLQQIGGVDWEAPATTGAKTNAVVGSSKADSIADKYLKK